MQHFATLCILLLAWHQAESITVTSRGEPPTPATSQNFTQALQLLERMLLSQQRQRRLIPYYSYYVVNNNNNNPYNPTPRPLPTPFPVQNTALDLLVKSLYSPYQVPTSILKQQSYQNTQQTYQPIKPTQNYQPKPQVYQLKQQPYQYSQLPVIRPSYADLLPYLVKAKPTIPPTLAPTLKSHFSPLPLKGYSDILNILSQTKVKPPVEQTAEPPSFPKLLSPLASVAKLPGPPATKNGKSTPGRAGLDYPTFHKIPPTSFSCASQRYKGFFADPDTSCQVWHYCDLNGGQASFLCPNGTIFSQVLLTCDWWFNVKCTNTLQAYVLNERLYKFIMPKRPSFPEDFTGPQVNDYLAEKQIEFQEKEQAKIERLKKKYKAHEFEDVDELQALLDKMRNAEEHRNSGAVEVEEEKI